MLFFGIPDLKGDSKWMIKSRLNFIIKSLNKIRPSNSVNRKELNGKVLLSKSDHFVYKVIFWVGITLMIATYLVPTEKWQAKVWIPENSADL